jgi:hypothetical protein
LLRVASYMLILVLHEEVFFLLHVKPFCLEVKDMLSSSIYIQIVLIYVANILCRDFKYILIAADGRLLPSYNILLWRYALSS